MQCTILIQCDEMIREMKANRIHLSSVAPNTLSVKDPDTNETTTGNHIGAADGKATSSLQRGGEGTGDVLDCVVMGNSLPNQPLIEPKFIAESSFVRNDGSVNHSFPVERDRKKNKGIVDAVSLKEETNFTSPKFNQDCYSKQYSKLRPSLSSGSEQLRAEET